MVVPFKLVRNPFNHDQMIPVQFGDDADVIFKTTWTYQNDFLGLGEGANEGDQWAQNKWNTRKDRTNSDVTVTNALQVGELGDDNKTNARKSLRNW